MKLRLPLFLLNSVLACFVSAGFVQAITISANTDYTTNAEWTENTTIGADNLTVTIGAGTTITQKTGGFNIGNNNLTLKGGGTLKIDTAATVSVGMNKTLAIDGMTLDLSNPAAKISQPESVGGPDAYTRLGLTVKNGGIVKLDQFVYDGSFGATATNQGLFKLDGGSFQFTNANDSNWDYAIDILAAGGKVEAMTAGKTVTVRKDDSRDAGISRIASGASLVFAGVGNFNTGTGSNVLTGAGGIVKEGSGTLTIGEAQDFQGGVELKGGTLVASNASSFGTLKELKVTGNSSLGGISSALTGLSLKSGVSLNVASIDAGAGLTLNGKLALDGPATMTGNLNIGRGNQFDFSNLPTAGAALLNLTGTLTLDGALRPSFNSTLDWVAGTSYDMISATSISGTLTNINESFFLSDTMYAKWGVENNKLQLTTFALANLEWSGGGNSTWTQNGTSDDSPWENGAVYTDESKVTFGEISNQVLQSVTLTGTISPKLVVVNATTTNYEWNGDGKLAGTAELQKTGAGNLVINTENDGYSGKVTLGGGSIEMGTSTALGSAQLFFNGGTLTYGDGVTQDVSAQIGKEAAFSNVVRVDTNGEAVSWAGMDKSLSLIRMGDGSLTLSGGTYTGMLSNMGDGRLAIDGVSALSGANAGLSGVLVKTGTGDLTLSAAAFNRSAAGSTVVVEGGGVKLSEAGPYSGGLNIHLKGAGTYLNLSGVNTNVTGTGTLTMGAETKLMLQNGQYGSQFFAMNVVLDAEGSHATINGAIYGTSNFTGVISGKGDLHLINDLWEFNIVRFQKGWLKNSYEGNTNIAIDASTTKPSGFVYDGSGAVVVNGQNLTPWGTGDVTIGGVSAKSFYVTISNLNAGFDYSISNAITLNGNNETTTFNLLTTQTGVMKLNGVLTAQSSGANGKVVLNAGKQLELQGGLSGAGAITVNMAANSNGFLTLASSNAGFTGNLTVDHADRLYLKSTDTIGGTISTTGSAFLSSTTQSVNSLSAASLGVTTSFLSSLGTGTALTVTSLTMTGADPASVIVDVDSIMSTTTSYKLASWTNLTGAFVSTATMTGTFSSLYTGSLSTSGGVLTLTLTQAADSNIWGGSSGIWSTGTGTPWLDGKAFAEGQNVFFGDPTGGAATITIAGPVKASSIVFGNKTGVYTLTMAQNGGAIEDKGTGDNYTPISLIKEGAGSLVIALGNNYSGGTYLKGGTLVMAHENALGATGASNKIYFDGGTLQYGTGITADISGRIADVVAGSDNTIRIDTNGNDVSWGTVLAGRDYVKSGAGALSLSPANETNFTNSITINGGSLNLSAASGGFRISGNLFGTGSLVKEGASNLYITSNTNNFGGTLDIKAGTTVLGAAATEGAGAEAMLGANASIIIGNGAAFRTHLGGEGKTFAFNNIYVKDGGSLGNIDGHANYKGNIHFNTDTIGEDGSVSYNSSGTSSLYQFYAKKIGLNGVVSGSGIVNIIAIQEDTGKDHRFTLSNVNNTFDGTYVLESGLLATIELATSDSTTGGVAKHAHFKLGNQKANLVISAGSASIAGLDGTAGTVSAEGGSRSLTINQASGEKLFAGTLADTANGATNAVLSIVKDGAGKLTLNQNNTYTGGTTVKNGSLILGSGMNTALGTGNVIVQGGLLDMSGNAMANALAINGGDLAGAGNYAGANQSVVINLGSTQNSLQLGGLLADKVGSISTASAGTLVRGVGAGNLQLGNSTLAVGAGNLFLSTDDPYPNGAKSIVELSTTTSTISMTAGAELTLDLRDADLVDAMARVSGLTYQILVTNGLLNMADVKLTNAGDTFEFIGIDGGNVVISGDVSKIYAVATNQQKTISSNEGLDSYNAVLVNGRLTLNLPGVTDDENGLTVRNLNGKSSSVINVNKTGTPGTATVILDVTDESSMFDGTLNAGTANFVKRGEGTQIFGGASKMNRLVVEDGDIELKAGSEMTLEGSGSKLESGTELSGAGSLVLNSDLTVGAGATLNGVNVTLNGAGSLLDLGTSPDSVISGLNGSGVLKSNNSLLTINTVADKTNTFEGTLSGAGALNIAGAGSQALIGSGNAAYDLSVSGNSSLAIRGTSDSSGVSYKSLNIQSGTVVLEAIGNAISDSNTYLTLASGGSVASGGTLAFVVNTDYPGALASNAPSLIQSQGQFTLESGSLVDVSSIDPNANLTEDASSSLALVLIKGVNGGDVVLNDGVGLKTSGLFDVYYDDTMLENIDGNLVLTGKVREDNYFKQAGTTANSSAAAELLWQNRKGLLSSSQLGKLMAAASDSVKSGDAAEARRVMAASVGSTVTSLLAAQRGSFRQQQMWIRNRTTQMGVNQSVVNEDMPYVNAWIQGNGSYSKLNANGDESGYSLNSWGGTAGVDIDINESLTVGTAFTADYGKLKATAADVASGDMDSYYVNLFARLQRKNWAHTLILTGAWTDATLNRTVSYAGGGYSTQGDTTGTTWGAMYEGTYDIVLNQRKTSIFQPVINAGIYSTRVDGYQETGAGNAGLDVGKMDETFGTLSMGGRLLGIVGQNILGRSCLGEVRMMVSQDLGNVTRSASVGYLNNPGFRSKVHGAKLGKTALQIGAGLSMPVGENSTIFADANADFRSGSNSVNGNIGYRYNF